jgi:hypothetical protein
MCIPCLVSSAPDSRKSELHPYYITGFTDGDGCFYLGVEKDSRGETTKWRVRPSYFIDLHKNDLALLTNIRDHFDAGAVYTG